MRSGVLAVSGDSMRAYIRRRRDLLGYTQESLAKALGVPYPTYRDFESGATQELKAGLFARVVDVLNIPIEHIKKLGKLETDTAEAGQLAGELLTQEQVAAIQERARLDAASMSDVELDRTLEMFERLKADPQKYGEWVGYGRRLLEELGDASALREE
jgi:transcriptional regulator with XRE-family HTH domain